MAKRIHLNDKQKKIFWAVFSMALAVFTIWMVYKRSEGLSVKDIIAAASGANKIWFGLAIIASALFIWFEGVAILSILKGAGYKKSRFQGLIYSTSDIYFSAITPSATGGQPASAYFMMRDGIPGGVVTATLILNLMMYTISIVVLGICAVIIHPGVFFGFSKVSKILIICGFTALTVLASIFMLILKKGEKFFDILAKFLTFLHKKKIIKKLDKKLAKLDKVKTDYASCAEIISGRPDVLLKAFMWNYLQRGSQVMVPMLIHISLGGKLAEAFKLFTSQCLITIGYNFVPVPGAMGIADYLMVDGFSGIMGREAAFELEMLSRGLTFYICVSVSGIITLIGYFIRRGVKK
ncbi:MAG: flippase-like domain-containing protein [Eubacterium sp.]|nr:flippase-like domain-containing protein [Eubacterium sp.]